MSGDLSDIYYLDELFDGLDARDDVPRSHRIYANWWVTRTGACLDDGQTELAEYLAELIDTYLPPDHRSIADVRATVAEHVDLDRFLHITPETIGRVTEQLTIAADNVVTGERPIVISSEPVLNPAVLIFGTADERAEWAQFKQWRLMDWIDWLEDHEPLGFAFWTAVMIAFGLVMLALFGG